MGRLHGRDHPQVGEGHPDSSAHPLLRDRLAALEATSGHDGRDFVFGAAADRPFQPSHVRREAAKASEAANKRRAEQRNPPLVPIELHSWRHTFVSLMHDAGLSLERIGGA